MILFWFHIFVFIQLNSWWNFQFIHYIHHYISITYTCIRHTSIHSFYQDTWNASKIENLLQIHITHILLPYSVLNSLFFLFSFFIFFIFYFIFFFFFEPTQFWILKIKALHIQIELLLFLFIVITKTLND